MLDGLGVLPEPLKERAARMAVSPRLYNLTISNRDTYAAASSAGASSSAARDGTAWMRRGGGLSLPGTGYARATSSRRANW